MQGARVGGCWVGLTHSTGAPSDLDLDDRAGTIELTSSFKRDGKKMPDANSRSLAICSRRKPPHAPAPCRHPLEDLRAMIMNHVRRSH